MIRMRKAVLILTCLPLLVAAGQETNTHLPLLRKLDAMRLPSGDFSGRLTVREDGAGPSAATESVFRQFSRLSAGAGGQQALETLLVCDAPARDAGKLILFARSGCWFQTPRALRPTRLSAQQVATHALVADWVNWRFAEDFDHVHAGAEPVAAAGVTHACTVLDLTPRAGVKNRPAFMRCWIDAAGRLWKAEIYSSSRKLMRTVLVLRYETLLGTARATRLRVEAGGKVEELMLDDVARQSSPDDYFDPAKLPALVPALTRRPAAPP